MGNLDNPKKPKGKIPAKNVNLRKSPTPNVIKPRDKENLGSLKQNRVKMTDAPAKSITKYAPGKIHTKYYEKIKKIDAKTKASYTTTMAGMKASAIRKSGRILKTPKPGVKETGKQRILNLREEQTRRIAAYTSQCGAKSYILEYPSNHEFTIGCGEVFLCAKLLKIEKSDGTIVIAKRMKTPSGKHKGRLAFCTIDKPHEYVATRSGDKVTILDNVERVDANNPKAVAAHVKILDQEKAMRESHATYFKKTEEVYRGSSYTPASGDFKQGGKLDLNVAVPSGKGILAQMNQSWVRKLSETQKRSILIIEKEFKKAGLTNPNLIAAAIVNSQKESSLRPSKMSRVPLRKKRKPHEKRGVIIRRSHGPAARGPNVRGWYDGSGPNAILRENSIGLFQMNAPASIDIKKGATAEQKAAVLARRRQFVIDMKDPIKNCAKVIRRIKSRRGKQLRAAAAAGMGVPELTRLFTIHIEICANRYEVGKQRGRYAMKMFRNTERPVLKRKAGPAEEISSKGGVITGRFEGPPWGKRRPGKRWRPNGRIRIKPGQKKWVIGSSTISGSCQPYLGKRVDSTIGHIGIGAYHAGRMLKFLDKGNLFSNMRNWKDVWRGKISVANNAKRLWKGVWSELEGVKPPSKIIFAGFGLNDIGKSSGSDRTIVERSIKRHLVLRAFFEEWGRRTGVRVKVLIATNQEHLRKGPIAQRRLALFNKLIRQRGLTHPSVDLAKKMKEKGWKTSSDRLHLGRTAAKGFVDMISNA